MGRVKQKDTAPEMLVRKLIHSLGYRYRLHRKDLPGKPDLTFLSRKKIIFVHGSFWHQHSGCKASNPPKSNQEYWGPKLRRNAERDNTQVRQLKSMGWQVCIVWGCEIKDRNILADRLIKFLNS